ncbi:MAG: prolyl oligopeptidase family serine peptidase [Chloroflexi bacterium]|nr:prolyl oligopeptidase family serine peptidase [Chloroflexota bacterium]
MKRLLIGLAVVLILVVGAYLGMSTILYSRLATIKPNCAGAFPDNTPAAFSVAQFSDSLDPAPYFMPEYETVSIPGRTPDITLSGWYVPSAGAETGREDRAVLVVHGLGTGSPDCRRHPRALLAAGMLHRAGYNVLLIDLRDHGDSTLEDGRWAGGTEEYLDVLSAWDWLMAEQGFAAEQIGIFAYSGGTGTTLIALGQEPRIAAIWLDSVFVDIELAIGDELSRSGLPTFLIPGGLLIARLNGDDLTAFSPLEAATRIDGRPVFITHAVGDSALKVDYAYRLADALRAAGAEPELWVTPGDGHVRSMFEETAEYERRLILFFRGWWCGRASFRDDLALSVVMERLSRLTEDTCRREIRTPASRQKDVGTVTVRASWQDATPL